MNRLLVAGCLTALIVFAGLAGEHAEGADSESIEAFYLAQNGVLTADQKESFDELPPEEQERIRKNYQKFKNLPDPEKEALRKRYQRWQELPPETKEELRRELRKKRGGKKKE